MEIAQSTKFPPALKYTGRAGKAQRLILNFILLSVFSFQLAAFLIGCTTLREYAQAKSRLEAISTGNLKGMSKVDIVKKFGQPVATSKSELSESWFYAEPKAIWLWFKEDKVDRWEVE